ncbi:MAG: YjhG/YagF family D-xylonate dehydratase [Planctomycetes bacterium]|nr:YjhG/YagF family D-xylonate dehydratase [Planctomycetota bacterium]MBL7144529.1 YjhG/YagF family D-xylonate dehydratase [Phycisphaerae bacterium]
MPNKIMLEDILDSKDDGIYNITTNAPGPQGQLPLTESLLVDAPSGDIFAMSQNAGMGWEPSKLVRQQFLLISTQGGISKGDGTPVALGYHTGHFELGLLMEAAAKELQLLGYIPFAAFCTDPCDGRTQGTPGMMDSLAYRNDAAIVFRRLIRSLPTRKGVLGVAGCDKGLPAMMMAVAAMHELPSVLVPGGVTLPPTEGEDLGKIQSIGARFAHGEVTLEYARQMTCRTCASPGGGCQFLGTAATSQVVGEALGLSLPHAALAPSGQPIWLDMARRSARALAGLYQRGLTIKDILTDAALHNAMAVYAAFGGSTNLLLHIPAIAHAAGLRRPTPEDWKKLNQKVPRLVDVLPNGPVGHPTVRVFLAGGVPEVMLKLRKLGLLDLDVMTVSGQKLGELLEWWEKSDLRRRLREMLKEKDNIDPDDVIMSTARATKAGLTSTITLPQGNLTPEGSVVKSTAIDPTLLDSAGVYRKIGPARVFISEPDAIRAIKEGVIQRGDVIVLICAGPMGSGMEEILEVTGALKFISWGKDVAVITDGRFSGVSTGACIGHVAPEALAGGPVGKVLEGDIIQIIIDCNKLEGSVDLIGEVDTPVNQQSVELGTRILAERPFRSDLAPRSDLPDDTRLWAALQQAGGGTWGGCVFDVNEIVETMDAGKETLPKK